MSLESFYGGKQGISPVIKGRFKFVTSKQNEDGSYVDPAYGAAIAAGQSDEDLIAVTMDDQFLDTSYEDVWYNELCIIDTDNKNNPNNGKIYRRTLKNRGDSDLKNRSAEYIGRIVGPAGINPFFAFGNLASVNEAGKREKIDLSDNMQISYPIDNEGTISSAKIDNEGSQQDIVPNILNASLDNGMLVPGATNNSIRYTWLNIVDDRNERDTQSLVYMGFEIPFPSLVINVDTANWNENVTISKKTGQDYDNRPFYHEWDIIIPRGVRGNAAGRIRLAKYNEFINLNGASGSPFLYDFANDVIQVDETGRFEVKPLTGPVENRAKGPTISVGDANSYLFVYDYIFYDLEDTRRTYTFFLGLYNEVKDISLSNDGTLTFIYSNTTEKIFSQAIQWIDNIKVGGSEEGETLGLLTITYNTTEQIGGTERQKTYTKQLPYPKEIRVNEEGKFVASFTGTDVEPITISSIEVDSQGNYKDFIFNYVNQIELDNDSKVLSYTTYPQNNGISLNNGLGFNYLQAMTTTSDYHLVGYHASNQYRPIITKINNKYYDQDGVEVTLIPCPDGHNEIIWHGIKYRNTVIYEGINTNEFWQDFGTVREVAQGLRVMSAIDYSDYEYADAVPTYTVEQFIEWVLNTQIWDTITVTPDGTENPYEEEWYELINEQYILTEDSTVDSEKIYYQLILNPYYNGEIPGAGPDAASLRGTFIYTTEVGNGSVFFFDYNKWTWVYAGAWGQSTITDCDIFIWDSTNNQYQKLYNDGKELSDTALQLLIKQQQTVTNLLPNLWTNGD